MSYQLSKNGERKREYLNKIEFLEKRILKLEEEKRWLEKEVREIHSELVEEKKTMSLYTPTYYSDDVKKFLERVFNEFLKTPIYYTTFYTTYSTESNLDDVVKFLEKIKDKIVNKEKIDSKELRKFAKISILATKNPNIEKLVREIILLLEEIPGEIIELKKGEIKEIDEDTIIRRRKDGVIEVIFL